MRKVLILILYFENVKLIKYVSQFGKFLPRDATSYHPITLQMFKIIFTLYRHNKVSTLRTTKSK